MSVLWLVNFHAYRPLPALPRLLTVACEQRDDPSYHHEGRFRRSERHALFKYTLSGEGTFRDITGEHAVGPGEGFLCRIADARTAYYYPPAGQTPWRFLYACFAGQTALQAVDDLVERFGRVFALPRDAGIIPRLEAWQSYDGTAPPLSLAEQARMVWHLLSDLAAGADPTGAASPAHRLARRAVELIEENLQTNLNVSELAERLDVSREHLTRVFTEQLNQSPYRYMLRRKILLACRLLKDTSLSNKEIAARIGYDNPAQLCRSFRKVMYMTPGQFRQVGIVPVR